MHDKEELLPCPCCVGVDLVDEKSYVMCLSCGLMICHDDAEHADFRSVWNTRPAPAVSALLEALQAIYDTDPQVPHPASSEAISEGRKQCIYKMRKIAASAFAQSGGLHTPRRGVRIRR